MNPLCIHNTPNRAAQNTWIQELFDITTPVKIRMKREIIQHREKKMPWPFFSNRPNLVNSFESLR
ncbi:hypothetical protein Scep_019731 [Stephania cephalantha]|uniref:Uncharacterized protein n=1 Tax=Stephania cephalantha TaxID=152367 RepID=A0AAP0IBK3_9MAGN